MPASATTWQAERTGRVRRAVLEAKALGALLLLGFLLVRRSDANSRRLDAALRRRAKPRPARQALGLFLLRERVEPHGQRGTAAQLRLAHRLADVPKLDSPCIAIAVARPEPLRPTACANPLGPLTDRPWLDECPGGRTAFTDAHHYVQSMVILWTGRTGERVSAPRLEFGLLLLHNVAWRCCCFHRKRDRGSRF